MAIETSAQRGGIVRLPPRADASTCRRCRAPSRKPGSISCSSSSWSPRCCSCAARFRWSSCRRTSSCPPPSSRRCSRFMRTERLCEVARRGANRRATSPTSSPTPGACAREGYLARSQYAGVAPVSLQAYCDAVEAQSVAGLRVTREDVAARVRGDRRQAGGPRPGRRGDELRARDLHLRPGGQRQDLPRRAPARAAAGQHRRAARDRGRQRGHPGVRPAGAPAGRSDGAGPAMRSTARATGDARWVLCERPVVLSGGELTLAMLDLDFDEAHALLPGAAARQGEQRHLHRRRPRPAARGAARPDEPLDRAARPAHGLPVAAHRPQVRGAVRRDRRLLDQPAPDGPRSTRRSCAGSATRSTSGRCRRTSTARSSAGVCAELGIALRGGRCSSTCCATTTTARTSRGSHATRATSSRRCATSPIYEGAAPQLTAENLDWAWHNYFVSE